MYQIFFQVSIKIHVILVKRTALDTSESRICSNKAHVVLTSAAVENADNPWVTMHATPN
jgi:hypothetical protein